MPALIPLPAPLLECLEKTAHSASFLTGDLRELHRRAPAEDPALEILTLSLIGEAADLEKRLTYLAERYQSLASEQSQAAGHQRA